MKTYTADEVSEILGDAGREKANVWLARGDGIAVYRNEDLGSGDLGNFKFLSFGSATAQFVVPPEQLPDFPNEIDWRFRLHGVYRSTALLTEPVEHDWVSIGTIVDMFVRNFHIDSMPEEKKWPGGRLADCSLTLYEEGLLHITGTVLTTNVALHADVTLSAQVSPKREVDRLGEFTWSVTLPDGRTRNTKEYGLGPAFVGLYNVSLNKEDA